MATTLRHFNRNIFLHVTLQQETAWPADRRSEVVRERPIRTQINTQPVKSAGKSIGEGFTKSKALTILPRSLAVQLSHLLNRNSRNSSAKISDSHFFGGLGWQLQFCHSTRLSWYDLRTSLKFVQCRNWCGHITYCLNRDLKIHRFRVQRRVNYPYPYPQR